jgi:DNA-binding response OmpR family regulator
MAKILLLEDDIDLNETIEEFLVESGYSVEAVYDAKEALDTLYSQQFDLLLLDVNVPFMNGFELLKSLRDASIQTPAIFITSLNSIDDLDKGFKSGADDYIRKPFELRELLIRVNSTIKKSYKQVAVSDLIKLDNNLSFDINSEILTLNNEEIKLRSKEQKLLKLLIKNRDQIVTFDEIFSTVWSFDETISETSLRTYIKNLRKILGRDKIISIKKEGYKLVSE